MPTRTINVGTKHSTCDPFLELHDGELGSTGAKPWVGLSHCWGGKASLTLTTDKLHSWQQGIPVTSMPKTFRDAVRITRELGAENLWIDSLCIIQDSREDWAKESGKMADIYRHSMVHIAAHTSKHSDDGIFKERPKDTKYVSLPFNSKKFDVSGNMLVRPALYGWENSMSERHSKLATRGWVLQETILSPRTLHFGSEQIFWECPNRTAAEGEMSPSPKFSETPKNWDWHFNKRFLTTFSSEPPKPSQDEREMWYNRWYQLVVNYSNRQLTVSTDVFPALSGLASTFSSIIQDDYVAGLFAGNILRGLLWRMADPASNRRAESYRAPTWSWASIVGPVKFEVTMTKEKVELFPSYQLKVLDVTVCPVPQSPANSRNFGAITEARLTVEGRWRNYASWDRVNIPDRVDGYWDFYDNSGVLRGELVSDVGPDRDATGAGLRCGEWGLLQISTWTFHTPMDAFKELFALILRPVSKHDVFERIGIARLNVSDSWDLEEMDATERGVNWETRTITLV
jgi:Heterokaryon incompatibility protein (HET)